ncbi:hypothetical protein DU508_16535 [Pedobacter chinensis]|uniref:Uncharacterized protein n=1 Tax=Pedobacter chinensis TaxID=2282421 RepID=A0A369PYP6_9SPHI|nr:hypothetical protein [Pedobacter chinensis]RDC55866.1 hypothetical protein DU508_16535 [Pedobacter chinensis]
MLEMTIIKNRFSKYYSMLLIYMFFSGGSKAQTATVFTVGGDEDKFYPVVFNDANWFNHRPTSFTIGRSDIHENQSWKGSIMAEFTYHTTNYGHLSHFIDANVHNTSDNLLIADWVDATLRNGTQKIIVWLKGGLSYHLHSTANVTAAVYDNVQNPLPYEEVLGPPRHYLTQVSYNVNRNGIDHTGTAYFKGGGTNFFNGNVGIGLTNPSEKLTVNGKIKAREIRVDVQGMPDYVFEPGHQKTSLPELERYIQKYKHLPEIPSAAEAEKHGIELGEMNKLLLKKIEELTLHLIEKSKELKTYEQVNRSQSKRLGALERAVFNKKTNKR